MRVAVIGLGTGTLADYGRPGDVYRFYEINPQVVEVARTQFTLSRRTARRKIETVLGDARLDMEREPPQNYDVIAIDAFSSDSIPVHLITREAMAVYLKHLKPDGVIAFHVTNRFLQLAPVVKTIADEYRLHTALISTRRKKAISRRPTGCSSRATRSFSQRTGDRRGYREIDAHSRARGMDGRLQQSFPDSEVRLLRAFGSR